MRHAWKKSWQHASAVAFLFAAGLAAISAHGSEKHGRANELTLAGLSPGRDKIEKPEKVFRGLPQDDAARDAYVWGDVCTRTDLRVEVDSHHFVRTVTVSSDYRTNVMPKCLETVMAPERLRLLRTGRSLLLGDACSRVTEIYGKPESESPSVKGNDQLELYFYDFGWAGSDVPQVMEISCSKGTNKIVEIMLAASSL